MRYISSILLTYLCLSAVEFGLSQGSCPVIEKPQTEDGLKSPLIPCNFLPLEYLDCDEPIDLRFDNSSEPGHGCSKWGGSSAAEIQMTKRQCNVLDCIECYGPRSFYREGFPCVKYTGHYFLSTLLYSFLLGVIGLDRFCLGHTGIAVGKLMTLGGLGVWWIVDIVLLVTGHLTPADESSWMPYY